MQISFMSLGTAFRMDRWVFCNSNICESSFGAIPTSLINYRSLGGILSSVLFPAIVLPSFSELSSQLSLPFSAFVTRFLDLIQRGSTGHLHLSRSTFLGVS